MSDGPAPNDLVINAPIIGTAIETLFKDGAGVMVMGGAFANNYAGFTTVRDGRLVLSKTVPPAINGDALLIGDDVGAANSAEVRLTVANQIANSVPVDVCSDGLLEMNGVSDTMQHAAGRRRQRPRRPCLGSHDQLNHRSTAAPSSIGAAAALRPERQHHLRDVDGGTDRGHQRKRHAASERRDARAQRLGWPASDRPAHRRQHRGQRRRDAGQNAAPASPC